MFQSLIGWLQTIEKAGSDGTFYDGFNPLQVGYKRMLWKMKQQLTFQFQSLIGWLQTKIFNRLSCSFLSVSIPYRLATNQIRFYVSLALFLRFNPLQVGYKLAEVVLPFFVPPLFQSLIGWLQTGLMEMREEFLILVSIPYRLATN